MPLKIITFKPEHEPLLITFFLTQCYFTLFKHIAFRQLAVLLNSKVLSLSQKNILRFRNKSSYFYKKLNCTLLLKRT
jgi:hypothetical protein